MATSSTAAEMSSMWLPGTAAAMPAIIASWVVSIRRRTGSGGTPTKNVRAASPCQPSTIAPASTDTIWPSRIDPLPGDAVDDLVVERDAQAGRERPARVDPRVALEGRDRAGLTDVRLGQPVEVGGRDAWLELALDEREDLGNDPTGLTHPGDLGARLAGDHRQARLLRRQPRRPPPRRPAATASIGWRPSTLRRTPVLR